MSLQLVLLSHLGTCRDMSLKITLPKILWYTHKQVRYHNFMEKAIAQISIFRDSAICLLLMSSSLKACNSFLGLSPFPARLLLSDAHPVHGCGTWEWAVWDQRYYINLWGFLAANYNGENECWSGCSRFGGERTNREELCCLEQFAGCNRVWDRVWNEAGVYVSVPLPKLWLSGCTAEVEIFLAVCQTKAMLIFYCVVISITILR